MLLNQYKLILIIYLLAKQQASNLFALPASLSLCDIRTRIGIDWQKGIELGILGTEVEA